MRGIALKPQMHGVRESCKTWRPIRRYHDAHSIWLGQQRWLSVCDSLVGMMQDNQARTEKALERLKAELVETEGMAQKEAAARRQAEQLASSLKTDQAEIVQAAQKRASQLEVWSGANSRVFC